jgi:hypothetical protein
MTAVGKILVFLNLVFSLVVGGFVAFAYAARTHWVDEFKKLQAQNTVLAADARTFQSELDKTKQDAAAQIAKKDAELRNAQQDLKAADNVIVQLRTDLSQTKALEQSQRNQSSVYTGEVTKRQDDVGQLRDQLRKRDQEINGMVKQVADFRDQATVAQIGERTAQERANRVEKQLQQTYKDMARMRANGASTTARSGGRNPPPEDVQGLVKDVDSKGGNVLMTLSIGSDSGLVKGHTLELFRLNTATASQSKYLGTVRILESEAHQAVAQPVGRLSSPPQRGDRVASRILGG